jgi:hypothetical protein
MDTAPGTEVTRYGIQVAAPAERQRQQADATALVRILRRMADPALHWRL